MKKMYLVWALLCASCGGDSFSANSREGASDGAIPDAGDASSVVRPNDDAGSAGASTGGSSVDASAAGAGGSSGGTGGVRLEDAGLDVAEGGVDGSDEGGAGGTHSAGAGGAGGVGGSSIGGTGGGGCELVTHDNGVGQTWQDCEPLETYNNAQTLKACTAWWCAVNGDCPAEPPSNVCSFTSSCGAFVYTTTNGDGVHLAWSRLDGNVWQTDPLGGGCVWAATWR